MKQERGIVVIVIFLLLIVLTMIAVGLTTRTRMTLQLTTASNARSEAQHQANGAQSAYLEQQRQLRGESTLIRNTGITTSTDTSGVFNTIRFRGETQCRRSRTSTAAHIVACRHSELESRVKYGKRNRGELSVITGLEQPVLNIVGG
jgi:type IV pilus assembly protein PilX